MPLVPELLVGAERERLHAAGGRVRRRSACPTSWRCSAAGLLDAFSLLDIVEIADGREAAGRSEVAGVYFALSERFEVDRMLTRITGLPRDDRWRRWPGRRCATTCTPRWPA